MSSANWCGSGSSLSLWCGSGSSSYLLIWCGSMRIRIRNTAADIVFLVNSFDWRQQNIFMHLVPVFICFRQLEYCDISVCISRLSHTYFVMLSAPIYNTFLRLSAFCFVLQHIFCISGSERPIIFDWNFCLHFGRIERFKIIFVEKCILFLKFQWIVEILCKETITET